MNTNERKYMMLAAVLLVACMGVAKAENEQRSVGEMVAMIDAGKWRAPKAADVRRCEYLVEQIAARYGVTQTQVGDAAVMATHKLLRDDRGIEQKVQATLEAVHQAAKVKDGKEGLDAVFVLYVLWRDQNP